MHFDVLIIGGGLSGLGAGIRLSHFGKRVAVFERHAIPGGMNGFYFRDGHCIDAGLHAMTNIAADGDRSAPLNLLLRQLRIKRSELDIVPQGHSLISFPSAKLVLDNSLDSLKSQIAERFPDEIGGFQAVCDFVDSNAYSWKIPPRESTRRFLESHIESPLLRDMLLFPAMYYGSATPDDMDLQLFCNLFRGIYVEGLGRPRHGMRPFIQRLVGRLRENGGELFLANGISRINNGVEGVSSVIDDRGVEHTADAYISSIGAAETAAICSAPVPPLQAAQNAEMAFIEGKFALAKPPAELGIDASVIFMNRADDFQFRPSTGLFDTRSSLLCMPGNFPLCDDAFSANSIKISLIASPTLWFNLDDDSYLKAKDDAREAMVALLESLASEIRPNIISCDLFTPKTIRRFTGHRNGAIYGSPTKFTDSLTGCPNLFLCGTDQGLYGIVGALISGNVLANYLSR